MTIRNYLQFVVALFMLSVCMPISAGPNGIQPDSDSSPEAGNVIADWLTFGGKIELKYEREKNFDIDSSQQNDIDKLAPSTELALGYAPRRGLFGYVLFELIKEYVVDADDDEGSSQAELHLNEAYLTVTRNDDGPEIQVGRQRFKDSREWYYDDQLDGVRVYFDGFDFDIEASITRTELFGSDLINHDDADRSNNLIVSAKRELGKRKSIAGFLVIRDDRTDDDEDPIYLGLRSEGRTLRNIDYWADIALVRGSDNEEKKRGYGIDLGATFNIDSDLGPYITVAYALGSGDANTDDNKDERYRQTGLQDNSAKLGGITKLQYYGELLDPELSNIGIATLGVGIRPTRTTSIDLLYHRYRQDKLSDRLNSPLDENPTGESLDIGSEIDMVVGYQAGKNKKYEIAIGYFMPGEAFSNVDNASFARIEAEYRF